MGLRITGVRPDGYHTIQTVYQEVTLSDRITLDPVDSGWEFSSSGEEIPWDEGNLAVKAYLVLKDLFSRLGGARIHVDKKIPVGAGLGGGSSNAATVLKGLNDLYGLGLSLDRLEEMGLGLGADVPFFIRGGTQAAEGIGEKLTPVSLPPGEVIGLVVPPIRVSTRWAYAEATKSLSQGGSGGNFISYLKASPSWELFENDFESLVFPAYPEIGTIKRRLTQMGAVFASLSGSGSTVFGIFRDDVQARRALKVFSPPFQTFLTHPIQIEN